MLVLLLSDLLQQHAALQDAPGVFHAAASVPHQRVAHCNACGCGGTLRTALLAASTRLQSSCQVSKAAGVPIVRQVLYMFAVIQPRRRLCQVTDAKLAATLSCIYQ